MSSGMSSSITAGACFVCLDISWLGAADPPTDTVFDERKGLFEVFDICLTSSAADYVFPPALFAAERFYFA